MKKVSLRALSRSDTYNIVRWRNNPSVKENLYSQDDITAESHNKYFTKYVQTGEIKQYIIVTDTGQDIGTIYLRNIDTKCKKAEFGIFIGEESARGKGYSYVAAEEILKVGFEELGLHRIYLTVMEDNYSAIFCYLKAGFKIEGTLKEGYLKNGKYIDVIVMGITSEQWKKNTTRKG